jgi:hypothetical protein
MSNYFKRACVLLALTGLSAVASAQQPDAVPAAAPAANTMPKLNVTWDCGECTVNEKVIPLLEEFYRAEAVKNGKTVSDTEIVDARIHDYRQRNPGARVMLGIMAGKDRLGLKISYNGEELVATDYSANAVQGMNALCESVAKKAYKQIAAKRK